jgi:hypothetical protein
MCFTYCLTKFVKGVKNVIITQREVFRTGTATSLLEARGIGARKLEKARMDMATLWILTEQGSERKHFADSVV